MQGSLLPELRLLIAQYAHLAELQDRRAQLQALVNVYKICDTRRFYWIEKRRHVKRQRVEEMHSKVMFWTAKRNAVARVWYYLNFCAGYKNYVGQLPR